MNIVTSPNVVGKVTVKLEGVPWREAMNVILRAHGFDYVEEHGILRVDTAEELRRNEVEEKRALKQVEDLEPLLLGMVKLHFANAEEVKEALKRMLTTRGNIDVDVRTNTLLINDVPARVEIIQQMATDLDSQTPQVEINAKLVDMDSRVSQELGIVWAANNIKDSGTNVVGNASVNAGMQSPAGQLTVGTVSSYGDLMLNLQDELKMGIILISHDLGVVSAFTERVMIMYLGQILEKASATRIFEAPRHPYTEALMNSIPAIDQDAERLNAIRGSVPPLSDLPPGCRFAPRCDHARPECDLAVPPMIEVGPDHEAACIRNTGYRIGGIRP